MSSARADWLANVSRRSTVSSEKSPVALPSDDQGADDLALAQHGYGDEGAPAGVLQDLQVRIQLDGVEVRHGDRAALLGGTADEGLVEVDPDGAQPLDDLRVGPVDAAHEEATVAFGVLHDRAAVGLGQLDRVLRDRVQDVVEVQAGADRLADLAAAPPARSTLRASSVAAGLELLDQLDAVDRHRRLDGERADDRHLPVVERAHVVAPDSERTDDLVVEDHRSAHRGAEACDPLQVVAAVLRVGQHVRDLLCPPVEADPADERVAVHRHRVVGDQLDGLLGHAVPT